MGIHVKLVERVLEEEPLGYVLIVILSKLRRLTMRLLDEEKLLKPIKIEKQIIGN